MNGVHGDDGVLHKFTPTATSTAGDQYSWKREKIMMQGNQVDKTQSGNEQNLSRCFHNAWFGCFRIKCTELRFHTKWSVFQNTEDKQKKNRLRQKCKKKQILSLETEFRGESVRFLSDNFQIKALPLSAPAECLTVPLSWVTWPSTAAALRVFRWPLSLIMWWTVSSSAVTVWISTVSSFTTCYMTSFNEHGGHLHTCPQSRSMMD